MNPIIEARGLTKIYQTRSTHRRVASVELRAVDAIDLDIMPGDYVAIMGASGSGKSTLMQILGLLDRATSGSLKILGQDVTHLKDHQLPLDENESRVFRCHIEVRLRF